MDGGDVAPALGALEDHGATRATGYVPATDPLVEMPPPFEAVEVLARDLPLLLAERRVRPAIASLPVLDVTAARTRAARERLFLALTALTSAWVWGGEEVDLTIPPPLARPTIALGRLLDRPPIVSHASMCLWNWRRRDVGAPVTPDNLDLLVGFCGGADAGRAGGGDETWFFTATLGVELAGAPLLAALHDAVAASATGGAEAVDALDTVHAVDGVDGVDAVDAVDPRVAVDAADALDAVEANLLVVADGMPALVSALRRMRERCDPDAFSRHLRPLLAGWPDPGVTYAGTGVGPTVLAGGSAGQSTLVQAFDAALGITHPAASGTFLRQMRRYMPVEHRGHLSALESTTRIRALAAGTGRPGLRAAYDGVVEGLDHFRRQHMALAVEYVMRPSGDAATTGTGGTDLRGFLREVRASTQASHLG